MLIQALFTRGGGPIHHNIGGFAYSFKKNRHGHYVAPVFSGEHREMMCRSGNFQMYEEPEEVIPEKIILEPEEVVPTAVEPSAQATDAGIEVESVFEPGSEEEVDDILNGGPPPKTRKRRSKAK